MTAFKKIGVGMLLTLCFCLARTTLVWSADDFGRYMPSEIVYALEQSNGGGTLAQLAKPTSLGITDVLNIDMKKVHQTYSVTGGQKQMLRERGYSEEEIEQMDIGDYFNIESTWIINPDTISSIKFLYPELADVDISSWTYGDFEAYYTVEDAKKYAPTTAEEQAFIDRNITLADAQTLLKDYYSYENVLAQSDEQLTDDLRQYYQFTINNIYDMLQYEKFSLTLPGVYTNVKYANDGRFAMFSLSLIEKVCKICL